MINRRLKISENHLLLLDQGVISGVNFLNAILLAKFLGVGGFGVLAMCLISVQFLSSVQQSLIIKPLLSLFPEKQKQDVHFKDKMNGLQLWFTLLSAGLFYATIAMMSIFFSEFSGNHLLPWLTAYAMVFTFYEYLRRLFILVGRKLSLLILDGTIYVAILVSTMMLQYADVLSVVTWLIINTIILLLGVLVSLKLLDQRWKMREGLTELLSMVWEYAKYLFFTSLLQWFSGNLFILFAGMILGPVALGVVRIAQSVMGVFNVFFLALENIVPLKAAQIKTGNARSLIPYFKKTTFKFGVPVLAMVFIIILLDKQIIGFVFGKHLISYSYVIVCFSLIYLLVYLNTMQQFLIRTLHSNHIIFKGYLAASFFGIICARFMVAEFQLNGVILGILFSQLLVNGINFFLIKRQLK